MEMSPIPKTAPFADEEIDLLNRVVGPASANQRAWLAGFLAGLEALGGGALRRSRQRRASGRAVDHRLRERVRAIPKSSPAISPKRRARMASSRRSSTWPISIWRRSPSAKRLVVIAATWGEGEPPARAMRAYNELMGEGAPRLDGVEFGVLALGDTAYAEFCAIGKTIDERLAALGGKRVVDRVDCDLDFAEPAARLDRRCGQGTGARRMPRGRVIEVDFGAKPAAAPSTDIVEAEIIEHIDLNSSRSGQGDHPSGAGFRGRRAGL